MERSVERFLLSFGWKTHIQTITDRLSAAFEYCRPMLVNQKIPEILALNASIHSLCNYEVMYFEWLV